MRFSNQRRNGENMKAYIYVGGNIFPKNITEKPTDNDICIAADSGYKNARLLGADVQTIVGDFDSISQADKDSISDGTKIITVPAEKDFTDTQLAVKTALEGGATNIVIIGGLSGRLDHTLSNLAILQNLYENNIRATITDGANRIRYIKSSSELIARSNFKYLSVIACDEKVKGVSVEGCKYPLKNTTLSNKFQYAVSNEILKNCALVSVKKGGIYIVESAEA